MKENYYSSLLDLRLLCRKSGEFFRLSKHEFIDAGVGAQILIMFDNCGGFLLFVLGVARECELDKSCFEMESQC
ncbi:hypothetical protein Nepgr_029203 [Nepenthes gracilis]|uniref:Uncharacterized protein n=1 Tax=Nepenthes gracilis TaxID=150966 RepID=A0AAD3Y4M8_NEPGR|nr:hypothetical protein Nepgr_029203 [Nepenthes gracilis]